MKKLSCTLLLTLCTWVAAFAQTAIDTKSLLGTWSSKKEMVTASFTYRKSAKCDYRFEFAAPQLQGAVVMKAAGTWRAEGTTLLQTIDGESISVKYTGSNAAIGSQIETWINANREMLIAQFGGSGSEIVLSDVVVADNLLLFTAQVPTPKGEMKEERMVLNRVK